MAGDESTVSNHRLWRRDDRFRLSLDWVFRFGGLDMIIERKESTLKACYETACEICDQKPTVIICDLNGTEQFNSNFCGVCMFRDPKCADPAEWVTDKELSIIDLILAQFYKILLLSIALLAYAAMHVSGICS